MKNLFLLILTLWLGGSMAAQMPASSYAPEPTIPSSDPSQGIVNCHELEVEFAPGNGTRRLVVMREGAPVDQLPVDGASYSPSTTFGNGTDLGNGNYVMYSGFGHAMTFIGLEGNVNYHYAIFEFNGTGSNTNYLTSVYLSINKQFPPDPLVEVSQEDISCFGQEDASISLDVSGGSKPYTFNWSSGDQSHELGDLSAGTYAYTVTDSVGCEVTGVEEITEPDSISITVDKTDVSCHDGSDGGIELNVSGGSGGYEYNWSHGAGSASLEELESGTFQVTVTDDNGCTSTRSVTIEEPPALGAEHSLQAPTCFEAENGSISLNPAGGTPPYEINWNMGATGGELSDLPAGTYSYTITDSEGCEQTGEIDLNEPASVSYDATIYDISCHGQQDGSIDLQLSGGTAPYTVKWSDGEQGPVRNQLAAGEYGVVITDDNGCEENTSFTIYEPDSLLMGMEAGNVTCEYKTDGSIVMEVSGGTKPYDFNWSDGATDKNRQYLGKGTYQVTVSDANGCQVKGKAEITEASSDQQDCNVEIEVFDVFTPNNDGTNEYFVIRNIQEYPDNRLEIYNRWGMKVYDRDGYQNTWQGLNNKGEELPAGTYYYVLQITTSTANTFSGSITFLR